MFCSQRNFAFSRKAFVFSCTSILFSQETMHSFSKPSMYLNIFHNSPTKVLHSPERYCIHQRNVVFSQKHLCSLAKLLCSPEKCCIISQKFALPQNCSQFSHTSIAFLRETFYSLAKHLHSLAQGLKIIWTKCPSHHILFPSQLLFLKVFIYVFTITMSFLGAPNKTN